MAKKRQIPCPYCSGEVLSEQNGQAARSASLFPKFQNLCIAVTDLLNVISGNTKTVSRKEAIGGKCEACGNKGTFDDPSDTSHADKIAADILKQYEEENEANLAKLGSSPGGSRLTRIAGADVLLVGHLLNTADSVAIKEKTPGPGSGTVGKAPEGKGGLPDGNKEYTHVQGLNTPANSGGGHYVIQCGNKFNLIAGAQGASIDTYGQLSLHGKAGVQITGAEVTIGAGKGRVSIGGNHVSLECENLTLSPSGKSGTTNFNGSIVATGNIQSGGAYVDNLYFSKASCPSKQVPVKGGSSTTVHTGPAIWGGTNPAAIKAALLQLQKFVLERTTDLDLFKACGPTTPRFYLSLPDVMYGLIYAAIPIELKPTGIAIGPTAVSVVFSFPHTHALHDGIHTHQVTVPAIDCDKYSSATAVRQAANAAGINSSIPAAGSTGDNFFATLWSSIGNAYKAAGGLFTSTSSHSTMT